MAATKSQFSSFVGLPYFLTAVLAPLAVLSFFRGRNWTYPKGEHAAGSPPWPEFDLRVPCKRFGVLLAFGAKGTQRGLCQIVFARAPVVNAVRGAGLANTRRPWWSCSISQAAVFS